MTLNDLSKLQNYLHYMLAGYLNGNQMNKGSENKRIWEETITLINDGRKSPFFSCVEELISAGYAIFLQKIAHVSMKKKKQVAKCLQPFADWKQKIKLSRRLKPIVLLQRRLERRKEIFLFAGLHGSYSTQDFIYGMSDVDTILVLRKQTVLDPKLLRQARKIIGPTVKYLYKICIFQHHEHHVISEIDLDFYPPHYFPMELMDYTTAFIGDSLTFLKRSDYIEVKESLVQWREKFGRGDFSRIMQKDNLYDMVHYNQSILFLPCLWQSLSRKNLYKKHIFKIFYKAFDSKETAIMRTAESLRKQIIADPRWYRLLVDGLALLKRPGLFPKVFRILTKYLYGNKKLVFKKNIAQLSSNQVVTLIDSILKGASNHAEG